MFDLLRKAFLFFWGGGGGGGGGWGVRWYIYIYSFFICRCVQKAAFEHSAAGLSVNFKLLPALIPFAS